MPDIGAAVLGGDWDSVTAWIWGTFDVPVGPGKVERIFTRAKGAPAAHHKDLWRVWIKNRLAEAGLFPAGEMGPDSIDLPVELHVGFLCIAETEEELARLRNEAMVHVSKPATPAIERNVRSEMNPINRTAARVVRRKE